MDVTVRNLELDDLENLNESELEELYSWVDTIPLSRPKRNINRDFSDGVLAAEVVKHFLPKAIDLHNYTAGSSSSQKMENWDLLNRKVFKRMNFQLSHESIVAIGNGKQFSIERFLLYLRSKVERALWDMSKDSTERIEKAQTQQKAGLRVQQKNIKAGNDQPEADQNIDNLPVKNHSKGNKQKSQIQVVSPGRPKGVAPAGPYRGIKGKSGDEMIPRAVYEEKEQECLAKEETIQILQAKVRRLEHLLHLKDIRLEDLQARLESSRPTGNIHR